MYSEEWHNRVMLDLESRLHHFETLARYTKKTTKLNNHKEAIKLYQDVIQMAKDEYEMYKP